MEVSKHAEATSVAAEFVDSLTEEALRVSNDIRAKEQYEAAKEVARDFIDDMNIKAVEIAEQMASSQNQKATEQVESAHPQRRMSVEISDGDLVYDCDLTEVERDAAVVQTEQECQDFTQIPSFLSHYVRQFDENASEGAPAGLQQEEGRQELTGHETGSPSGPEAVRGHSQPHPEVNVVEEDIWANEAIDMKNLSAFAMTKTRSEESSVTPKTATTKTPSDVGDMSSDPYMTAGSAPDSKSSRPSSSDVDAMLSAVSATDGRSSTLTTTADYETAHSHTASEAATSTSFHTAASSLRSTETSEATSGNLASYEISEASETITATLEHDRESIVTPSGANIEDLDPDFLEGPHLPSGEGCRGPPPGSVRLRDSAGADSDDSDSSHGHMVRSAKMVFEPSLPSNLQESQDLAASAQTISSNSEVTTVKEDEVIPQVCIRKASSSPQGQMAPPQDSDHELRRFAERSYSIQQESIQLEDKPAATALSDTEMETLLEAHSDPYNRPTTPVPPTRASTVDTKDSDPRAEIMVESNATGGAAVVETELAFSKHFTQVIEESPIEFEKPIDLPAGPQVMRAVETADSSSPSQGQDEQDFLKADEAANKEEFEEDLECIESVPEQWIGTDDGAGMVAEDEYQYLYNQPLDQIAEEDEIETDLTKLKETLAQVGSPNHFFPYCTFSQ